MILLGAGAIAGEADDLGKLEAIYQTALTNNAQALTDASAFAAGMRPDTSYAVHVELLKTRIPMLIEAGQGQTARAEIAELLELGTRQSDLASMALARIWAADQQANADHPDEALSTLIKTQAIANQSANPVALMLLNRALGSVYSTLGEFDKALEHGLTALRLAEQQPRRRAHAQLDQLNRLGSLYSSLKNPTKALATFNEALKLAPEVGSQTTLAAIKVNQGNALADLGRSAEALVAYEESLAISRASGLVETEIVVLINLADHHLRAGAYERAAVFARQALAHAEQIDNKSDMAVARANLGFALAGQGRLQEGVVHINAALSTYRETGSKSDEEGLTAELSAMYEKAGLLREALTTSRQQLKLSREIFRADQANAISGLQERFNAEQRQKEIELLARKNQLKDTELANRALQQTVTLLGTAVILMACVFMLLLYRRVRQTNRKLKKANNELEFHSTRDPLTGLCNRRSFLDLMERRLSPGEGGRRENDAEIPDGLMILDVDHFKHVNDTWGHAVGDAVLVEVAQRLKNAVRESDMVLRWGGEEFLVYSPGSNLQQLTALAERLLRAIGAQPMLVAGQTIAVTVTAGFIALPYAGISEAICNWEKTLQIADMALYLGKVNGRNRAYGVGPLLVPAQEALPVLDHDLSAALKAGMLELIEVIGPPQAVSVGA